MLRIRENIFETNSSSAHSIVLRQKYNENSVEKNLKAFNEIVSKNNNTYVLDKEGQYSCNFRYIHTWREKLKYAIIFYHIHHDNNEKIINIDENDEYVLSKLKEVSNIESISYVDKKEFYEESYIDHASVMELDLFVKFKEVSLIDFIFNDRYALITDNDNDSIFGYGYIESDEEERAKEKYIRAYNHAIEPEY